MSLKKDILESDINNDKLKKHQNNRLASLIDKMQINNLEEFYNKENSAFMNKIDKLNLQFYLETENYLNYKHDREKSQNKLFIILFKQINSYIGEIERLNKFIKQNFQNLKNVWSYKLFDKNNINDVDENRKNEREIKGSKINFLNNKQHQKENKLEDNKNYIGKNYYQDINFFLDESINYLKSININSYNLDEMKIKYLNLEKKIIEKINNEKRLNFEINNLKRQIKFYNEKLQVEINDNKCFNKTSFMRNTINPNMNFNFSKTFIFEKYNTTNLHEDLNPSNPSTIINNNINNFKNCDIININNNTYNTIITGNNTGSRESSTNKKTVETTVKNVPDNLKLENSNLDLNLEKNKFNKSISNYNHNLNEMRNYSSTIIKENTTINDSKVLKNEKSEKTIFGSVPCNNENLITNSNSNIEYKSSNIINNEKQNTINLNQNSVIKNSSSNKNVFKSGKNSNSNYFNKKNPQTSSSSILKMDKQNQASNSKILPKKRNYSDNNPQQQNNQNFSSNLNTNEGKNLMKTLNANTRYSFVEQKTSKNLSPKNILDVYNNNKNKKTFNNDNIHSTNINSNSNSNSISNNPLSKNPLVVSLNDLKHSSFNKNNCNSLKSTQHGSGKNISGKELTIINTIKQSVSLGKVFNFL